MIKKIKVMTIVGTRPEIIKLSEVMKELDNNTDHIIVHTGQNYDYELNELFFEQLNVRTPDYFLEAVKGSVSETIGDIIAKADKILADIKPDAVLIYGDTNSCLSVIPAKKRKIPIFHMEAGNRCFDQNVPEEINRKIIDGVSDINIVLTENARNYLISEGFQQNRIFNVGSFVPEISLAYKNKINKSKILGNLKISKNNFILASIHREENLDLNDNLNKIILSLEKASQSFNKKIILSTHPRTQNKIKLNKLKFNKNLITFHDPFSYFDYIKLAKNSFITISDSGTIVEDCLAYEFKAIMLRETNERPEGFDNGNLFMVSPKSKELNDIIKLSTESKVVNNIYQYSQNIMVSDKILKIVLSYKDYVNKYNWSKF